MPPITERAWAAGFFDGEGTTTAAKGGYPRLVVCQVDRRPLDRLQQAVGLGKVRGPYAQRAAGCSPQWQFAASNWRETIVILASMWDFLSEPKREQALRVLEAFSLACATDPRLGQVVRDHNRSPEEREQRRQERQRNYMRTYRAERRVA